MHRLLNVKFNLQFRSLAQSYKNEVLGYLALYILNKVFLYVSRYFSFMYFVREVSGLE